MKKSAFIKKLLSMFMCLMTLFSLSNTAFAKIIILDSWLPFETWTGSGTASVELGDNYMTGDIQEYVKYEDFEELLGRNPGNDIDADDYIVSEVDGVTVITLNEEYLKTLDDNIYYYFAEFKGAQIPVVLYVVTEKVTLDTVVEFEDWAWDEDGYPGVILSDYEMSVCFAAELLESVSYKGEKLAPSVYSASNWGGAVHLSINKDFLRTLPTGTHYFEAVFMNADGILLKIDIPPMYTLGDYSGDGNLSAEDARAVLRASAKLDNPEESNIFIADIDADGKLTASDARRILRVSAKLEKFNVVTVELDKNEVYETPVMIGNVMNSWFYDIPENSDLVCEKNDNIPNTDPFLIGASAQRFAFSASEPGVYNARLKYVLSWESDSAPIDEVYYIITVK